MKVHIGKYKKKDNSRKVKVHIDHYDVWSLDHTLALIILPAMKEMAKHRQGVPCSMFDQRYFELNSSKNTPEEKRELKKIQKAGEKKWSDILDAIIWSFEQIVKDDDGKSYFGKQGYTTEQYKEYFEKVQKGLTLFGEHYQSLWT